MEFAKEVYRQTLIKEEEIKIEAAQKSKHLVTVAKPTLPDDYTYPNKLWDLFTLVVLLSFFYGIVTIIVSIIKNHQD
jgi:capsular polysaccharide transport system permease protein